MSKKKLDLVINNDETNSNLKVDSSISEHGDVQSLLDQSYSLINENMNDLCPDGEELSCYLLTQAL